MMGTSNEGRATADREVDPACVVHVDLDGYADICRVHGWAFAGQRDAIFESGLRNAFEFLARYRVRATLFTIAQDIRDAAKKELLREAVGHRHEIGSHTTTHRDLRRLGPEDQRKEICESRDILEQSLGVPVLGFRAPGFSMDARSLGLLEPAGYHYDSSLFPDSRTAKRVGLDTISCSPHFVSGSRRLLELPMPAYAPLPVPFHPSYSLILGNGYFRMGIRRVRRTKAPLVLLFHLTDFADPLPTAELPGWKAKIYTLSFLSREEKLRRCARMLDLVRQHYRIVNTADLVIDTRALIETSMPAQEEQQRDQASRAVDLPSNHL
jgi:peptidoglycan/xylan/chitin deacetylase (PgdA/CDA1 family)